MSQRDKSGFGSVMISTFSAWLGLGAPLGLLCLALLAVTSLVVQEGGAKDYYLILEQRLGSDIKAARVDSFKVEPDGTTLVFRLLETDERLTYEVNSGRLSRTDGEGVSTFVVNCPGLKFHLRGGVLSGSWVEQNSQRTIYWALKRWGTT